MAKLILAALGLTTGAGRLQGSNTVGMGRWKAGGALLDVVPPTFADVANCLSCG